MRVGGVLGHLVLVSLLLVSLLPQAAAEFGPESDDGWPINVDGDEVRPPVDGMLMQPIAPPLNKLGPVTAYPYYPILTGELQRLALDHPDKVHLTSAGKSVAGLDVWMLEIADFDRIDAGEGLPLDPREVVYLDGGTHSNEYSGVYFVTEWAQFLLDEYDTNETAQWIVENRHTFIVPMVNPDGSHVFGRLNAQGVNINRNFPATWGETDESFPMNNPGPEPASEPETRIVIDLFDTLKPDYAASIHCCGNLWLYPYGAESLGDPEDEQMYSRICDEVYPTVRDVCGPIWSTIYPASGSTVDESYDRVGAVSFGFEMSGRGAVAPWGQPLIMDDVRDQERESWAGVEHAFLNVHRYGAQPEIVSVVAQDGILEFTVANIGWLNLTGNITVGTTTIPIDGLEPGERVRLGGTYDVDGGLRAGLDVPVHLDWTKRLRTNLQDSRSHMVSLVEADDGRLVGQIGDLRLDEGHTPAVVVERSPAPLLVLPVVALVGLLAVLRRKG